MTIEELTKYINDKIDDINNRFPNLINSTQRENYIKSNINLEMTSEQIEEKAKEIDNLYDEIIKQQERILELRKELARELQNKKDKDKEFDYDNLNEIIKKTDKELNDVTATYIKKINELTIDTLQNLNIIYANKKWETIKNLTPKGLDEKTITEEKEKRMQIGKSMIEELLLNYYGKHIEIDSPEYTNLINNITNKEKGNPNSAYNLLQEYKKELARTYLTISNTVSIALPTQNLTEINESIHRENQYLNEIIDGIYATSGKGIIDYIIRTNTKSMRGDGYNLDLPNNPFDIYRYDKDKLFLNKEASIYQLDAKMFEPVIDYRLGDDGIAVLRFGQEWISKTKSLPCKENITSYIPKEYLKQKNITINGVPFSNIVNNNKNMIEDQIDMTNELSNLLSDIEQTSLLSSQETADKYMQTPQGMQYVEKVKVLSQQQLAKIQEQRKNNPELSDAEFYKKMMIQFLNPVVQKISEEYKSELPVEKMQKVFGLLNPDNITFSLDKSINDIQADSQTGKLIINPEKTIGTTIEEKIVSSMGTAIHETFHLMINMLKTPEQAEKLGERLMYKVATSDGEKELHFAPGKYGQVLSEGFVEKISSEFAQKNGFYHTLNPSYIPYVNLCSYIQKQSPSIDNKFLFTKNADDVVAKMTPSTKNAVESTERLAVFNKFEVKEIKKDESLKGIKSNSVVSSWMERNDKKVSEKKNDNFQKTFTQQKDNKQSQQDQIKQKKSDFFSQRSQSEIQVHQHIKQKNQAIKQQKAQKQQLNKQKVKTLSASSSQGNGSSGNKGYTNIILLSLIVSFVCGALFMVVYMIIGR